MTNKKLLNTILIATSLGFCSFSSAQDCYVFKAPKDMGVCKTAQQGDEDAQKQLKKLGVPVGD